MSLTPETAKTVALDDCCPAPLSVPSSARPVRSRRVTRAFVRHYVEMVLAMFAGMIVVGLAVKGLLMFTGADAVERAIDGPIAAAAVMCAYMVAGMAAWMAYRRHTVRQNVEMNLAMVSPMVLLVPLEIAGTIDGHGLMIWLHVLMFGAMWLYMLWRPIEHCH